MSKSPKGSKNVPETLNVRPIYAERPARKDVVTDEFIRRMRGSLAKSGVPAKLERDADRELNKLMAVIS
jgi:hypothetical protein